MSIHWGGNWGYEIPNAQINFSHKLVDALGVDVIHAHSSHHIKGLEVYNEKLIIYGAGDFINDYEGISGHEKFRNDLSLMYFVTFDAVKQKLIEVTMKPMKIKNFSLHNASTKDTLWLKKTLEENSRQFGVYVKKDYSGQLKLIWDKTNKKN